MLEISHLSAAYPGKQVLHDVSLQAPAATVHGIVGGNGAGKTTFFNTVYGFHPAAGGSIQWSGRPLERADIGYLETDNFFYSAITGREYLRLFPGISRDFPADEWAELLHLPLDEWIDHYSTGMKKKLALLAVIKTGKPLLLLDEPYNGLDLESQYLLRDIVLRLKAQGRTILLSSHILETLTPVCDAIYYLAAGGIQQVATPAGYAAFEAFLVKEMQIKFNEGLDRVMEQTLYNMR
jgi:ABC-2 type transport system ATP-binding protein